MSTTQDENVEQWITHAKALDMSQNIIQLYPIIKNLHKQFETDIIHIDLERVELLFNEQRNIIRELVNPENPCWHPENPFPINCIANDEEIASIWDRKPPGTEKLVFTQRKIDIEALIKLKNENPLNTILLVCTFYKTMQKEEKVLISEVCTCYMIRLIFPKSPIVEGKKLIDVQHLLTVEPTAILKPNSENI